MVHFKRYHFVTWCLVSFEFLVIRPFIHDNMKSVLGRCFSKSTKLIGHRGAGATKYYSKQVQAPRRLLPGGM